MLKAQMNTVKTQISPAQNMIYNTMIHNNVIYDDANVKQRVMEILRLYFTSIGYKEVYVQDCLSILAACEDPETLTKFCISDQKWPLPQTGQMELEKILMDNSYSLSEDGYKGVFCITTSYRDEKAIVQGRHSVVFPMFEFEGFGNSDTLVEVIRGALSYIGIIKRSHREPYSLSYSVALDHLYPDHDDPIILTSEDEGALYRKLGEVIFLNKFPRYTEPFWNMQSLDREDHGSPTELFNKMDVILCGNEVIGSAVRSSDIDLMEQNFFSLSEGKYAQMLFTHFGEPRVRSELNEFLSLPMVSRFGGGIGVGRLVTAMRQLSLLSLRS